MHTPAAPQRRHLQPHGSGASYMPDAECRADYASTLQPSRRRTLWHAVKAGTGNARLVRTPGHLAKALAHPPRRTLFDWRREHYIGDGSFEAAQ